MHALRSFSEDPIIQRHGDKVSRFGALWLPRNDDARGTEAWGAGLGFGCWVGWVGGWVGCWVVVGCVFGGSVLGGGCWVGWLGGLVAGRGWVVNVVV